MDKYTGKKLDGRYEIGELIGVGGMAYVYHCYDTIDDREVSIKILKDEYLHNADFIRRFKNESKAIAVLSHPNIVKIYDVSFGDMIQYIVMEYIDGITLKEYIEQQGIVNWREAIHFQTQILKALDHAHRNGIFHRDIKPQNIMLLRDGTIKVTDFGIARFADNATRTMTDRAIGSVHYISPEQARGGVTDSRADIYSVGVMFYEMVTGVLPFDADNAVSVAIMQLQATPKKPTDLNLSLPAGIEDIILKAMQKNTSARYQSAKEMLNDIERFKQNPTIRFNYKCHIDDAPTKYVSPVINNKTNADEYEDDFNYPANVRRTEISSKRNRDDDLYADDTLKKTSKRKISIISGIVAALFIMVAGVLFLFFFDDKEEIVDVDVPQYIGMMLQDVKMNNPNNFVFEVTTKYDEQQSEGIILDQDPKPNSKKIKQGSTIKLVVNGKDENVTVPYLIGYTQEEAVKELEKIKLVAEILEIEDNTTEAGKVVKVSPSEDTKLMIGSTVVVYVSKGVPKQEVSVPSVIGYSYEDAIEKLRQAGLMVKTTYDYNSDKPKDTVVSQEPLPYSTVEEKYTVELVLSAGITIEQETFILVDLPKEESNSVTFKLYINGVLDDTNTKDIVPKYSSNYSVKVKGTGVAHIVVELNGSPYREYDVDFSTQIVTTTATYQYKSSTAVEPTQGNTDSSTQSQGR